MGYEILFSLHCPSSFRCLCGESRRSRFDEYRLFFFAAFPLFGAYVGNPADPALMNAGFFSLSYPFFKFTSGYIYDYTSDKRYEAPDQAIKQFGLHSQLASFSLIFVERLQLFGTAGASREIIKQEPIYDTIFDVHTQSHFSWSAGAKVILFQWGQTYLSGDFTYFAIPASHKSFFQFLNRTSLPLETETGKLSLREWQVSAALSSRFFFLTPYAGGTYLHSRLNAEVKYRNELQWGYFFGLTLSLTGRLHLNFERRMRDEQAYTFATVAVF